MMNRLFAIGDIHGCFRTFYELVNSHIHPEKSDRIILLGDYIDRGPGIREVVDYIMELIEMGFNVTPLMGNHEWMLVNSYDDPRMLPLWYLNEGITTLESFGIANIRNIENEYIKFFRNLIFYEKVGDFYFVHGGFNDTLEDPFSDKEAMLWESRLSYSNPVFTGKTIVHGHRPKLLEYSRKMVKEKSKVIPIDTGCVYGREMNYGYLSALDVGNMELISIAIID
ncbi:MAG: serine/threonine protein phosphatase [Bacteroidales bacterium]|nr:serine/threonine protein phosphatase [Bacteroidales bacterium]